MSRIANWLADAEATLDRWGRGAWIGTMVLGFIIFWPLGLAILGYMIWSGRMACTKKTWRRRGWQRSTGNAAFDEYREATLSRLEEEQAAFETFLGRLRRAKDQAEFNQFMDERRTGTSATEPRSDDNGGFEPGNGFQPA